LGSKIERGLTDIDGTEKRMKGRLNTPTEEYEKKPRKKNEGCGAELGKELSSARQKRDKKKWRR